jgi:hypothetical protein
VSKPAVAPTPKESANLKVPPYFLVLVVGWVVTVVVVVAGWEVITVVVVVFTGVCEVVGGREVEVVPHPIINIPKVKTIMKTPNRSFFILNSPLLNI